MTTALEKRQAATLRRAKRILAARLTTGGIDLGDDGDLQDFLRHHLGEDQIEHGLILALDSHRRLLGFEKFSGELHSVTVSARRVATLALGLGGTRVILGHSHPRNFHDPDPSDQDILATRQLRETLGLIGLRLLDHFVVSGEHVTSVSLCSEKNDCPTPSGPPVITPGERFAQIARHLSAARTLLTDDAPHSLLIDFALKEAVSGIG